MIHHMTVKCKECGHEFSSGFQMTEANFKLLQPLLTLSTVRNVVKLHLILTTITISNIFLRGHPINESRYCYSD